MTKKEKDFWPLGQVHGSLEKWVNPSYRTRYVTGVNALETLVGQYVETQIKRVHPILLLGPQNGHIIDALLKRGVPAEAVWAIEINPSYFSFLKKTYVRINLIRGNALDLCCVLPQEVHKSFGTIICNLPTRTMSARNKLRLTQEMDAILFEQGVVLQFCDGLRADLAHEFSCKAPFLMGRALLEIPFTSLWGYSPAQQVNTPQETVAFRPAISRKGV